MVGRHTWRWRRGGGGAGGGRQAAPRTVRTSWTAPISPGAPLRALGVFPGMRLPPGHGYRRGAGRGVAGVAVGNVLGAAGPREVVFQTQVKRPLTSLQLALGWQRCIRI